MDERASEQRTGGGTHRRTDGQKDRRKGGRARGRQNDGGNRGETSCAVMIVKAFESVDKVADDLDSRFNKENRWNFVDLVLARCKLRSGSSKWRTNPYSVNDGIGNGNFSFVVLLEM